ncbi:MAG: YihY/virulence factor BrkB family protein [Cyanobacteria bacterium P01_A01_bin.135]
MKQTVTRMLSARPAQLIIRTCRKWQQDECLEMGASLSYYALFSLFPIFLVVLSVAGFLLGPDTATIRQLLDYAKMSLPPMAYQVFADALLHLNESSTGAGITGFFLVLFTSSNVFRALDRSVDKIWKVHVEQDDPCSFQGKIVSCVHQRILAFTLVLVTSALMLVSILSNVVLKMVRTLLSNFNEMATFVNLNEVLILKDIQIGMTFLILFSVIITLFKVLPSTVVYFKDIWLGSLLTSGLLVGLQQFSSNSIVRIGSQYQSYGLIGGMMVLLMWIYFTCQVFLIGSVFTYVYTHLYGSRRSRPSRR